MKKEDQSTHTEPAAGYVVHELPLVVHRHAGRNNQNLVVFVHGLGGRRYGNQSTWGNFPKFLFEDFPHVDVGLYSYRTLAGRLAFWKSISLRREAEIFAQQLRDDEQYRSILLVGHSMGGLLSKAVVQWLHEAGESKTLKRLSGLLLMAVPQAGSIRVPAFSDLLSSDAAVLKAHGEFVSSVTRMFQNHVDNNEAAASQGKIHLPTWAVKAASDFWVDWLSAGLNLPDRQMKTVHGSHTSFVKPKSKDDEGYKYVYARVSRLFGLPQPEPGGPVKDLGSLLNLDSDELAVQNTLVSPDTTHASPREGLRKLVLCSCVVVLLLLNVVVRINWPPGGNDHPTKSTGTVPGQQASSVANDEIPALEPRLLAMLRGFSHEQREAVLLQVPEHIQDRYREFLASHPQDTEGLGAGMTKILLRSKYDKFVYERNGGGAYYSFIQRDHGYQCSDIQFARDGLSSGFAGLNYGFFMPLGSGPIDQIETVGTPPQWLNPGQIEAWQYMWEYDPPILESRLRSEQRVYSAGEVTKGDVCLVDTIEPNVNQLYLLRSIQTLDSDVLVVFRVEELDRNDSIVLAWRVLKSFAPPIAIDPARSRDKELHEYLESLADDTSAPPPRDSAGVRHARRPGELWNDNGLQMRFRWCPPGTFNLGGYTVHEGQEVPWTQLRIGKTPVTLAHGFWLAETEVTQLQWRSVMRSESWRSEDDGHLFPDVTEGPKHPATWVGWYEATQFCRVLTIQERSAGRLPANWEFRLPTEAQWEYACRAFATTAYSFGAETTQLSEYCWFKRKENGQDVGMFAQEVGKKKPNDWGFYDMHGNVWEWCRDRSPRWFEETNRDRRFQLHNDGVIRGGSWRSTEMDCQSASAVETGWNVGDGGTGFRPALVVR